MEKNEKFTKEKQNGGITLIALIVTIIVLVLIAGVSIAALTSDNGIIRQTNTAKVEQIEAAAREQVKLGVSALRIAIAEASSKDNSYRADNNVGKIQAKLVEILNQDKTGLNGEFGFGGNDLADDAIGTEFKVNYTGDDYKNACNYADADIVYTITLRQKTIEVTRETNATLKDQNQNDATIDVGGNNQNGSSSGQTPVIGTKLVDVASIGDYVNYDPTTGGNATSANTTYTSMIGSTTSHGNGYTKDADGQTFSASNYKNAGKKWRILNIEGEKITLISEPIYQDSGTIMGTIGLILSDGIGYIWGEEELHRIASIYGHGDGADTNQTVTYYYGGPNDQELNTTGENVLTGVMAQQGLKGTLTLSSGARALTVEDINGICEAKDSNGVLYTTDWHNGTPVTKVSSNAKYYPTLNTTNTTTGQSVAQSEFSGSYYYTDYNYSISSANADLTAQISQNEMLKVGTYYWLASRSMYPDSSYADFSVRRVDPSGDVYSSRACYYDGVNWLNTPPCNAVMSLVTLKSGIQTSDTEYDDTTGWNLIK